MARPKNTAIHSSYSKTNIVQRKKHFQNLHRLVSSLEKLDISPSVNDFRGEITIITNDQNLMSYVIFREVLMLQQNAHQRSDDDSLNNSLFWFPRDHFHDE